MDFSQVDEGHAAGEEVVTHYYNHAERIRNAPTIVQEYYAGRGPRPVKGLFRVLVSNRGNRFMLASIFILCAFLWVYTFFINKASVKLKLPNSESLTLNTKAFTYDEKIFINVEIPQSKNLLNAPLETIATFYYIDSEKNETGHDVVRDHYIGKSLSLKAVANDYDIKRVNCHLVCGDSVIDFTMQVSKP